MRVMRQTDFSDAFAAVVKRHREVKKLSKAGLAERAGLHQTYIGLLERGERNPSLDTSSAIARALDLPLSELVLQAEKLSGFASKKSTRSSQIS